MMTIQKPKRTWQKKKDYMRKKTIRGLRRKGKRILQSFDDGTDDNIRKQIEKDFPSSKAFGTILPDYTIVADPTFTRDKTGAGEIEYFNEPEITYANGYKKANPVKGPSLVYNPNSQTEEDIKLDLLHHYREYDPVYQDLLKDYTNTQDPGQILYNSELGEYFRNLPKEQQTNENWNKLVKENLNGQYMVQGIDGSLRGLMASDKLRSSGRYPSRTVYEQENLNTDAARKAYQNIVNYLTSERLPEVIVKPKKYKRGKDCFDIGVDDETQQIYQDGDQYFAGPNINAATTKVTPYVQRLPNDKSTQHRLENTKWHKTDWNTFLHSRDAYRRALEFGYPDEALFPTLMHDAGKLWTGDGHGPYGASIIKQMFPDATDEQIMAIYGHMTQEPYGTLGNLVKGADIHIPNKWRDAGLQQAQNHNSGKDIHIKKANRGKFTEAANEHNMGVQEFARQVLSAPKGKYSSTLRKRANFARNFAH